MCLLFIVVNLDKKFHYLSYYFFLIQYSNTVDKFCWNTLFQNEDKLLKSTFMFLIPLCYALTIFRFDLLV